MKVMLLNGSPHEKGCTYTALEEIQRELKKCGVDSEILHVGQEEIHGWHRLPPLRPDGPLRV